MNKQNSFTDIPKSFLAKWQEIADLLAKIFGIPAALIMKTENEFMEVFITSNSENNPYHVGDKEHWHDLYCETVIKKQKELLIPNAVKDVNWDKNPDIKLGMIAYCGLPLNFPDGIPFGTICILDNKENPFLNENRQLLFLFKNVIELDLALIQSIETKSINTDDNIIKQLLNKNEELYKAKEHAEESDRLKTAFLQNMSHEIRTPLNAISGFSGMLNKPELSEEKRKSFVSIIQNSSKQLISIVTDILTISSLETKQEKANIDKVCINNIIVDLLAIFKQQAQNQNISLYAKQHLSDKQSEIYTDKTKITQILTNLLTNALKFTHEGFIEFGYNLKDSELEYYVKDSGIGIKPEFHEKIFERFRQADKSINKLYGGTGLGLAISKAFAELLGGKIWVQSELEKGSTFYFTIPYKPTNEIDKTTSPTKQNENFRTILVAEDEEYNFLFIEELLIDMDLKLIHSKDGKETVEIFKSNPNIDLILMDIKMPIMTGHEAAKIIKELKPDLPIVAQSGYALEQEGAKYAGIFDDYLTKPINEDDLKQMVMKYIDIQKKE